MKRRTKKNLLRSLVAIPVVLVATFLYLLVRGPSADPPSTIHVDMTPAHIEGALARIPMGRFLKVEEIAAMVAWIASPECSFTTGAVFDLSGGRATY